MKFNISYPITGQQKSIEVDDEKKVAIFYDKRMGAEVPADTLGDEFKGYVLKITGGNDRDGFPMMQGVMAKGRVRLLLDKRHKCYRPRRSGERKRKSVRGCIVGQDIKALAVVIVKKGEQDIAGITTETVPRRLGPKRANHIRKLYNLQKKDDVRRYVVRRTVQKEGKKPHVKAPRIQRLVTAERLRRKRLYRKNRLEKVKRNAEAAEAYVHLRNEWRKAQKAKAEAAHAQALEAKGATTATKTAQAAAPAKGQPATAAKGAPATQGKGQAAAPAKGAQAPAQAPAKGAQGKAAPAPAPAPAKGTQAAPAKAAPAPAQKGGKK
eukprot:TRINITY_DN2573_c0_g3_i2.p1 TRINITY_DN2573_c0_g3~~TRINITY_DN2573_c0_g3_i2.p1  ORF type:complete len:323 (+),score=128.82 TRINITY_DN2573_c0_g3_i2:166-1134(+)